MQVVTLDVPDEAKGAINVSHHYLQRVAQGVVPILATHEASCGLNATEHAEGSAYAAHPTCLGNVESTSLFPGVSLYLAEVLGAVGFWDGSHPRESTLDVCGCQGLTGWWAESKVPSMKRLTSLFKREPKTRTLDTYTLTTALGMIAALEDSEESDDLHEQGAKFFLTVNGTRGEFVPDEGIWTFNVQ